MRSSSLPLLALLCAVASIGRAQTFGEATVNVPSPLARNRTVNASSRAYIVGLDPSVKVKLIASDRQTLNNFGNVDLSLAARRDFWYTFSGTVTPLSSCPVDRNLTIGWRFVRLDTGKAFGPAVAANVTVVA